LKEIARRDVIQDILLIFSMISFYMLILYFKIFLGNKYTIKNYRQLKAEKNMNRWDKGNAGIPI